MSTICILNDEENIESTNVNCLDIPENDVEKSKATDEQAHKNLCKTPEKSKVLRTGRKERSKKLFHYRTNPVIDNENQDLEKKSNRHREQVVTMKIDPMKV